MPTSWAEPHNEERLAIVSEQDSSSRHVVAIFRDPLLNISETFIVEQTRALPSYRAIFIGVERPAKCLALPGQVIRLTNTSSLLQKWRCLLYRRYPIAPWFHVRVSNLRPQLVHAHFAPDGKTVIGLAERLNAPLIVTLHGFDVTIATDFIRQYRNLWQKASLFICVSEFIRGKAIQAGFPPDKLLVHHIGIDVNLFRPPILRREPRLLLFVGRLVEKKGCETLIRAMVLVAARVRDVRLVIIGDGQLRARLDRRTKELAVPVEFLGARPAEEVLRWMQRAAILCVPSQTARNGDSEGLPTVVLEALASRLPVVASSHAGIPEVIEHEQSGLLTEEGSCESLAAALIKYLEKPDLAYAHASNGRERVLERFDVNKQSSILEGIYKQVVGSHAPARS
jgi:colanic acid/amylovoran biosynthesis glycosyltransferase